MGSSDTNSLFESVTPSKEAGLLLIISKPKSGKTTILAQLPNSVILDYERGTSYITHPKVFFVSNNTDWRTLIGNTATFDFGIIDSVTSMELYLMEQVKLEYNKKVKPESAVSSYEEIPHGAGYGMLRNKTYKHIMFIKSLFKKVVIAGHSKPAQIRESKIVLDPGLTGKNADLVLSQMDSIAYLRTENEKRYLNFHQGLTDVSGSRLRLNKKEILISEDTGTEIITHWNDVYNTTINK